MNPDSRMQIASVKANSRKIWPTVPPARPIGAKTEASVSVVAITANPTSSLPRKEASIAGMPLST